VSDQVIRRPPLRHSLYLRSALQKSGGAGASEGEYSPSRNERVLALGSDHGAAVARMVSFHESFHAILNGSTTFGNAMVMAGALQAAGYPGFEQLIERMISSVLTTHETYATVASIYSTQGGAYERSLLQDYPDYLALFDQVAAVLDLEDRPYIASVCLESAARVALQTNLLETWCTLPCEAWPEVVWTVDQTPDIRFERLLSVDVMHKARSAVMNAVRDSPEPFRRVLEKDLAKEEVRELLRRASATDQDAVSQVGFDTFAEVLRSRGMASGPFDGQRQQARKIVARVKTYAGPRLKTDFEVPDDLQADRSAVVRDFRRERIVLRPEGQVAHVACLADVDSAVLPRFVNGAGDQRYIQLVALPVAKVRQLYTIEWDAQALDECQDWVTGIRRRVAPDAAMPDGLVEILTLRAPEDLDFWKGGESAPSVRATVCASILYETSWAQGWLSRERSRVDELAVLIDIDPFNLAAHLAKSSVLVFNRASIRLPEGNVPGRLEALVLTTEARPEVVHFTPCSGPMLDAVMDFIDRELPGSRLGGGLDARQNGVLGLAMSHVVREEPMFGFDFWD
jgi:hypothetical protein